MRNLLVRYYHNPCCVVDVYEFVYCTIYNRKVDSKKPFKTCTLNILRANWQLTIIIGKIRVFIKRIWNEFANQFARILEFLENLDKTNLLRHGTE